MITVTAPRENCFLFVHRQRETVNQYRDLPLGGIARRPSQYERRNHSPPKVSVDYCSFIWTPSVIDKINCDVAIIIIIESKVWTTV